MPLYLTQIQLHPGDLGEAHRQPRGPPEGRHGLHRIGRREAPRLLVRLRALRRHDPVGGARRRVDGRGGAGDRQRRRPELDRDDRPPDRRGTLDGAGKAQGVGPAAGHLGPHAVPGEEHPVLLEDLLQVQAEASGSALASSRVSPPTSAGATDRSSSSTTPAGSAARNSAARPRRAPAPARARPAGPAPAAGRRRRPRRPARPRRPPPAPPGGRVGGRAGDQDRGGDGAGDRGRRVERGPPGDDGDRRGRRPADRGAQPPDGRVGGDRPVALGGRRPVPDEYHVGERPQGLEDPLVARRSQALAAPVDGDRPSREATKLTRSDSPGGSR